MIKLPFVLTATRLDELWAAIEALPNPEPETDAKRPPKQDEVITMLRRPEGGTVDEVASATGWQRPSNPRAPSNEQRDRDRKFADSPLEGTGFEISVPRYPRWSRGSPRCAIRADESASEFVSIHCLERARRPAPDRMPQP